MIIAADERTSGQTARKYGPGSSMANCEGPWNGYIRYRSFSAPWSRFDLLSTNSANSSNP